MKMTFLLALSVALLLGACGQEEKKDGESWLGETATTTPAEHPGSPGGTAVVPDVSAGTTVVVLLEDGRIAVRETAIPPGPTVFTVTNGGSELHDLFIEGPGAQRATDAPIPVNGSRNVSVDLQPGTYTLYCPVLDHREKGETMTLTIPAAGSPATTKT